MPSNDSPLVSVRDLAEDDVPLLLDYWFRSPSGYLESIAVDPGKMPTMEEMEKSMRANIEANKLRPNSKLRALVITHNSKPVGIHSINPLTEGDFGIFHAHIWDPSMRGKSIGLQSYPLACRIFMDRFELQKVVFKTPIQNKGAIRVKEKLGIRSVGFEEIGFGIIRDGTRAQVFELTRDEALRWNPS